MVYMVETGRRATALKWASILVALSFVTMLMPNPNITGIPAAQTGSGMPPNRPMDFNSTSEIEEIVMNIDEGLMSKHIQDLQDFRTRYAYRGDKSYDVAAHINSLFKSNGLDTYYGDFIYSKWKMRNVIGVKPGVSSSTGTVIICGHYDSITAGSYPWTDAPGADDNGSGVAAVMAAAEILSDYDFNLTIKFIAFGGEELGLRGSTSYATGAVAAGENITAVINLDMIAFNPAPGTKSVRLYEGTIGDSYWLKSELSNISVKYQSLIGIQPVNAGRISSSDHQPFSSYYQSVLLIEDKYSTNPNYHKVTDTLNYLNLTYCSNITQLAIAAASELAGICSTDSMPPAHTPGFPGDGKYALALPRISIEFTDASGIDAASVLFMVDDVPVSPFLSEIPLGYNISFVPPFPLTDSAIVNVSVSASDILGHNAIHSWSFVVDAIPPEPPTDLRITASSIGMVKRGLVVNTDTASDSKHAQAPSVLFKDGEYKMWYGAFDNIKWCISYANSSDGLAWAKYGPVLTTGSLLQPDSSIVSYPTVLFDGEYKMWYSGYDGSVWRILYANSSDGLVWTKHGVVLSPGSPGSFDDTNIYTSTVLKAGEYKMWYTGVDGLKYHIMYANSTDGVIWTKHNQSMMPAEGPGERWGDAGTQYPEVDYDGQTYRMWYNRIGSNCYRTHYAESADGLAWDDMGLAMGAGEDIGTYDRFQATLCSAMVANNETRLWYSGFDGSSWRIMFANASGHDFAGDISLSWAPSPSSDVVRYEVFRESRPSAFHHPLQTASHESYDMPGGLTPWAYEKGSEANITVYGPVAGSDPPFFSLPDDSILSIDLHIRQVDGSWHKLVGSSDYGIDTELGLVNLYTALFTPGCTIHAWYNHSAGRALRVYGNSVADIGANYGLSYYYLVRSVDRAGNYAYCIGMPGKVGIALSASWNLIGNPFLPSSAPVEDVLAGLDWSAARTWDPALSPNHWTINRPGNSGGVNTLQTVDNPVGIWVRMNSEGAFAAYGQVSNLSINLTAGWNLVSYPYHESLPVSQALAGVPWDRVEICDDASPTLLRQLAGNDILMPGQGLWVRVTSDAVWTAVNVP